MRIVLCQLIHQWKREESFWVWRSQLGYDLFLFY